LYYISKVLIKLIFYEKFKLSKLLIIELQKIDFIKSWFKKNPVFLIFFIVLSDYLVKQILKPRPSSKIYLKFLPLINFLIEDRIIYNQKLKNVLADTRAKTTLAIETTIIEEANIYCFAKKSKLLITYNINNSALQKSIQI